MLGDDYDNLESMESAAEQRYEERVQPDGRFKCQCGAIFDPNKEGGPPDPNPFSLPVCETCLIVLTNPEAGVTQILFSERMEIAKEVEEFFEAHPQMSRCAFGHVSALSILGYLKKKEA